MVNPKSENQRNSVKKKPLKINLRASLLAQNKSVPSFMGGTENIFRRKIKKSL